MGNSVDNDWVSDYAVNKISDLQALSARSYVPSPNVEMQLTPQVQAEAIIAAAKEHEQNRQDLIAKLQAQRDNIDEALAVLLGHKKPTPAKKRGRPTGTKNRKNDEGGSGKTETTTKA